MPHILPTDPLAPSTDLDGRPARVWVAPAVLTKRDYARVRRELPAGMPDCLEVCVIRHEDGVERATSAVYGKHVYLIHYAFQANRD